MDVREKQSSEKRLIDADALRSYMDECSKESRFRVYYGYAESFINDAPTINAVPVVRCRECKHHRDKDEQEQQYLAEDILICTSPDATDDCWNAVWPDHFCSYGERKEGAD